MRDVKRLCAIRKLACIRCSGRPSQAAYSNSSKHGKGLGVKASDEFTVPLCHRSRYLFDTLQLGTREELEAMFDQWLDKTEKMLKLKN
ncbi:hypothetical protein [Acinetobacter gyllenbergii]|uniref:hypothetical protein n=1 Tax=Acinetobacter gyllenbergii TaxID=134534 RepID=UPI003F5761A0